MAISSFIYVTDLKSSLNIPFPITAKRKILTEHIYRKFPGHIEAIQELLQKGPTFREICDDYEEVCSWVESHCRQDGPSSKQCDGARQLIRDLEYEILKALEERL